MPSISRTEKNTTILFVVNDPRFFLTHRLALARGIQRAGYEVHLAVPTKGYGSAPEVIAREGITVHEIAIDRQGLNPVNDLRALLQLASLYKRVRPDIVHHVT